MADEAPLYSSDAPLYGGQVVNATYAPSGAAAGMPPPVPLTGKIVTVVSPDGRVFGLDEAHMPDAIAQGYRAETPDEAGIREEVAKNKGWKGSALVAAHHFADAATFGVFDPLAKSQMDPYERAKFEAVEKDHRAAGIIGELGGFGASLFYGGEFAKGAEAAGGLAERAVMRRAATEVVAHKLEQSALEAGVKLTAKEAAVLAPGLARSIAGSAARMGTEAAVFAAPKAVTEAALGDPEHAAETLAYNLGAGAVLGGLGSAIGGGAKLAIGGLRGHLPEGGWAGIARDQTIKSFGFTKPMYKALERVPGGTRAAADVALEHGLAARVGESAEEHLARVRDWTEGQAMHLGELASRFETAGPVVDTGNVYKRMREEVLAPLLKKTGHEAEAAKVENWVDSFAQHATELSGEGTLGPRNFRNMTTGEFKQELKALEAKIRKDNPAFNPESIRDEFKQIEAIYLDSMDKGVEAAASKVHMQDAAAEWRKAKLEWQVGHRLDQGLTDNIARGQANRFNGLGDRLKGMVGGAVGGMVGGPAGIILGDQVGNQAARFARMNGNGIAARVADWMAGGPTARSGIELAERANAHAGTELERIPSTLETAMRSATAKTLPANAIAHFLGEPPGTSRQDSYETLRDRVGAMAADPARLTQATSAIVERMGSDIPNIQAAYATQTARIVDHIAQILPKNPHAPVMFGPPETGWTPSKAQLDVLEDRVGIIADPFSVMRRWRDQTLTQPEVETLKTIYPKLADAMKQRIMGAAASAKPPVLEGGHRLKLGLLLGAPVDPDQAKMTAFFQDAHRADFAGGQEKGNVGTKLSAKRLPELQTATQRVAMKG